MDSATLVDLSPAAVLAAVGAVLALGPVLWIYRRHAGPRARTAALALFTVFLTFDLVLFGAFTRLTDSGLGCPDWPGCYGHASPLGAQAHIASAQEAMPTGPVTHGKAWVEMVHRYLATAVGALIMLLAWRGWRARRVDASAPSPWWGGAALVWVCVQGAFGALTVTMKLYPAVVTTHLLLGLGLLALLAAQAEAWAPPRPIALSPRLKLALAAVASLAVVQMALGGWVSTNYAVLACSDFPTCQGRWWPPMEFGHAYTLRRELGETGQGDYLPFAALTAIHMTHRLMAVVVLAALLGFAAALWRRGDPAARRFAAGLAGVAVWQLATGVSNVVLGWPLVAAVGHTGGAAALAVLLARLAARAHAGARVASAHRPAPAVRTVAHGAGRVAS